MRPYTKLLLCVVFVGCTSSAEETDAGPSGFQLITFTPMFSAFDGVHEYAVTPSVPSASPSAKEADPLLASSIQWELDGAFVKKSDFADLPAAIRLTTKKSGITTVGVRVKTLTGVAVRSEAKFTISKAHASEWDAGEERYQDGEKMRSATTAESLGKCGLVSGIDLPKDAACSTCHNAMSSVTIEHTPTQTAGYSDQDLIDVFTHGAKPAGFTYNSPFLRAAPMPDCLYKAFHTWEMTDDEKNGIVWKLRSIAPKVQERP